MEYSATERGGRRIHLDGFIYVYKKELSGNVECWECERRRHHFCRATLRVRGEDHERIGEHDHGPSGERTEMLKVRCEMRRLAQETNEPPQGILGATCQALPAGAAAQMPSLRHVRRTLRRHRQRVANPYPVPLTRRDFDVPHEFSITAIGAPFLLHDSGRDDPQRILVFGSEAMLERLSAAQHWFADGTFKPAPNIFFQLYTLHFLQEGAVYPAVYALLPNKRQETYVRLLNVLRDRLPEANPASILIDMEIAAKNACQAVFPNANIKACFFHFCQALYRRIQDEGRAPDYAHDLQFALKVRKLAALAFVPPVDVIQAFEDLALVLHQDERAVPICDYFEDTYIGRPAAGGIRRAPMFGFHMWSMTLRLEEELPRTNNHVEAWHRRFETHVQRCHPNLWRFLQVLKEEEGLTRLTWEQAMAGHQPEAPRRRYTDAHARLRRAAQQYGERPLQDFLRGIAHNIGF